jgi:hypothetical protein
MVFHGYPDVEPGFRVGVPHLGNVWFYMGLYCAPQGGKGVPHVIVLTVDMSIG